MKSWLRTVGRRLLVAAVCLGGVLLVRAELPAGYTALEWVAASGTQWVNTGYAPALDDKVTCDVEVRRTDQTAYARLFGATDGANTRNCYALLVTLGTPTTPSVFYQRGAAEGQSMSAEDAAAFLGQRTTIICDKETMTWTANGETKSLTVTTPLGEDTKTPMLIFAYNHSAVEGQVVPNSLSLAKLYRFKIETADGVLKRDLVPCRNVAGEAGLWDLVEGKFHGNSGTGLLRCSDEPRLQVSFMRVPKGGYVDTGFKPNNKTRTVMDLIVGGKLENWFGSGGDGSGWWNDCAYALSNDGGGIYVGHGSKSGTAGSVLSVGWRGIVELNGNVYNAYQNYASTPTATQTKSAQTFTAKYTMFLFGNNESYSPSANRFKDNNNVGFYSCQVYDNGTLVRDFRPVLEPWGQLGLADMAHDGALYANLGSPAFRLEGLAYTTTGSTLFVHEGKLAEENLEGMTALEKAGWRDVDASAVLSYVIPVTIARGTYSFSNAAVQTIGFESLTLKGGARLVLDAAATGCDALAPNILTIDATAENPVQIQLAPLGLTELSATDALPILSGVTADDLEKFALVPGLPAKLEVREGNLVVVGNPTEPAPLPAGYTSLAFIAGTGSQYIRTGVNGEADTIVEMTFGGIRYGHCSVFFGEDAWTGNRFLFNMQSNAFYFHSGGTNVAPMDEGSDWRVWVGRNKVYLEKEGSSVVKDAVNTIASANKELAIFATNAGGNKGSFRLYTMKIMNPDGTLLRDYVPVRNPEGEPGLWDRVSGTFFGNAGTGHFITPDEEAVRLTRIHIGGGGYIDTGFVPNQNTRAVVDVVPRTNVDTFFGAWGAAWNSRAFALSNDGSNMYLGFGGGYNAGSNPKSPASVYDGKRHLIELDKRVAKIDGVVKTTCNDTDFSVGYPLFFFAQDRVGAYAVNNENQNQSVYRAQVYDNGTLVRDFIPYRLASGEVGMLDIHDGVNAFYPNKNMAANASHVFIFDGGIAYNIDGTTLKVHEGEMVPEDLGTCTDVEKVDWYALDAAKVTNYPGALSILKGSFSVANGVAANYTVTGALTLAGGTRLSVDVTATESDTFTAASLVLADSVTEANPIVVTIQATGLSELAADRKVQFFPGKTFAAGDERKFRATGLSASFMVENGALVLVAKEADVAVWTGAGANGLWSNPANWLDGNLPQDGYGVRVPTGAGTTTFDLTGGINLKALMFTEGAGTFVQGGAETLTLLGSLENASEAGQTFTQPLRLGVAGASFDLAAAGDVTITGAGSTVAADELVKTGAGILILSDELVAKGGNFRVKEGTLRLANSGRVNAAARAGSIYVENGARFDINTDHGNGTGLVRIEGSHGKTIYIEGDGPDGEGALYNSRLSENWGFSFGHVVLTGNASTGGRAFMSVRPASGSAIPGAAIEGPYTLTVRNRLAGSGVSRGFCLSGATVNLARINVLGDLTFEGTLSGAVTNGIHFCDGTSVCLCNATLPETGFDFIVEDGATITHYCDGRSYQKSAVTMGVGSKMKLAIGKDVNFDGPVTLNDGSSLVRDSGSGVLYLTKSVAGTGSIIGTGIRFTSAARWVMTADENGWTSKANFDGATDTAFFAAGMTFAVTSTGTQKQVLVVCDHCNLTGKQLNDSVLSVVDGAGEPIPNCWLGLDAQGRLLLTLRDDDLVRTAEWTGGADSALDDPANWVCRNDSGVVEGKLPMGATIVTLPDNCVFNCTNGAPFTCLDVVTPARLGGDCDWSGLTMVSVTNTIDLQGHKLFLPTLAGTGTITDTTGIYQMLEYIYSPRGAWLDTQFLPTEKTRLVMDLKVGSAKENWFGTTGNGNLWWQTQAFAAANDGGGVYVGFGSQGGGLGGSILANGWRGKIELNRGVFSIWQQGAAAPTVRATLTSGAFTAARSLWLFANNTQNTGVRLKDNNIPTCYSCQVYENDVLKRDYWPARRLSDGAIGMIDRANGNTFTASATGTAFTASPLTRQSLTRCGELHVVVAEGRTVNNSTLNLAGNLVLVKEGPGELTMTKQNQTYAGGTEVREGLAYAPVSGATSSTYAAKYYQWGGGDITVYTNATFDTKGNYDYEVYKFNLVGGTLANTGCEMSPTDEWSGNGGLTLLDDSTLLPTFTTRFTGGTIDLGGYTLTVPLGVGKTLWFRKGATTVTNGTFNITSGGWFHPLTALDMHTVDVVMGAALNLEANVDVRNYEQRYSSTTYKQGSGQIRIHGIYTPTAPGYIQNFVMCDGSAFNLGTLAGTFAINGQSLSFADGATMTVDIGKRPASNKAPVIGWGENPPANLAGLTFKAPQGARYRVFVDVDGVYVTSGLTLILR